MNPLKKLDFTRVKSKRNIIRFSILLLISILLMLYSKNISYGHYSKTIVKITDINTQLDHEEVINKWSKERYYVQNIQARIMNGENKGQVIFLKNVYAASQVYTEKYQINDNLFVELNYRETDNQASILYLKRDQYFIGLLILFVFLTLFILRLKGFFSLMSIVINILVFSYALIAYENGHDLLALAQVMVLVFTISSLIFIGGFNRKTLTAITSTIIVMVIMSLIIKIMIAYSNDIDYAFMDYLFNPKDLEKIFNAQLLISGLGAVMDIAIMMSTLVHELILKNPSISRTSLWKSGRALGFDVMGSMINVMLFTYLCGSIPLITLKLKLGISLSTIALYHMPMELYRFLLGGIAIMIAMPIALVSAIVIQKKVRF